MFRENTSTLLFISLHCLTPENLSLFTNKVPKNLWNQALTDQSIYHLNSSEKDWCHGVVIRWARGSRHRHTVSVSPSRAQRKRRPSPRRVEMRGEGQCQLAPRSAASVPEKRFCTPGGRQRTALSDLRCLIVISVLLICILFSLLRVGFDILLWVYRSWMWGKTFSDQRMFFQKYDNGGETSRVMRSLRKKINFKTFFLCLFVMNSLWIFKKI